MKTLLISFFCLMLSSMVKCQDKIYELIKQQTCDCVNKLDVNHSSVVQIKDCMAGAIRNNAESLYNQNIAGKYPDSLIYKKSLEYGQALGRRLDTTLIYDCEAYFKIVDSLRLRQFHIKNQDSVGKIYDRIKSLAVEEQTPFLEERARASFLLGKFEEAARDAEELLGSNPNNVVGLIIKGHHLENEKKFREAALIDYRLAQITGQSLYLVWAAINNRKFKEGN